MSSESFFYVVQRARELGAFMDECPLYDPDSPFHLAAMIATRLPVFLFVFAVIWPFINHCFFYWVISTTLFVGKLLGFIVSNVLPPLTVSRSFLACPMYTHNECPGDVAVVVFLGSMKLIQGWVDIAESDAVSTVRALVLLLITITPIGAIHYFQLFTPVEICAAIVIGLAETGLASTVIFLIGLPSWNGPRMHTFRRLVHLPRLFPTTDLARQSFKDHKTYAHHK